VAGGVDAGEMGTGTGWFDDSTPTVFSGS